MTEPRVTDFKMLGDSYVQVIVILEDGHEEIVSVAWLVERWVSEAAIAKAREQRLERENKMKAAQQQAAVP